MKVEINQSNTWITGHADQATMDFSHSTAELLTLQEVFGGKSLDEMFADKKIHYTENYGMIDLRKAIASLYSNQVNEDEVLLTNGCCLANFLAYYTFLKPGDEIVMVTPNWAPVISLPKSLAVRVRFLHTKVENDFKPTPSEEIGRAHV